MITLLILLVAILNVVAILDLTRDCCAYKKHVTNCCKGRTFELGVMIIVLEGFVTVAIICIKYLP